jgi:uncharacterized repeat protein (TIGR03833 family)
VWYDILIEAKNEMDNQRMECIMDGQNRANIQPGVEVDIVLKKDQRTGKLTRGVVKDILTNSSFHPHGIKVRLQDGQVGRVKEVF